MSRIVVTQTKSKITETPNTRKILQALGLGKIGNTKVHKDNNCIRGMVNKVRHLVSFELLSD